MKPRAHPTVARTTSRKIVNFLGYPVAVAIMLAIEKYISHLGSIQDKNMYCAGLVIIALIPGSIAKYAQLQRDTYTECETRRPGAKPDYIGHGEQLYGHVCIILTLSALLSYLHAHYQTILSNLNH